MDSRPTYHRGRFSVITKKSKITFPHIFIPELIRSTFFTKQNNHFYNSLLYDLNIEATFLWLLWLLIKYNYLFLIIKTGFTVTLVSHCILCSAHQIWKPNRFLITFSWGKMSLGEWNNTKSLTSAIPHDRVELSHVFSFVLSDCLFGWPMFCRLKI